MPPQKQTASGKSSPKRTASKQRGSSRGRPRKRSESPGSKAAERPASASPGRGRVAKRKEPSTSPPPARTPSGRGRRAADSTPRGASVRENSTEVRSRTTEVRSVKTESSASGKRALGCSWLSFCGGKSRGECCGQLCAVLKMALFPAIMFAGNLLCFPSAKGGECSVQHLSPESNNSRLREVISEAARDWPALGFLLGWTLLQAVLYLLPIGRVVDGYDSRERLRYRVNLPYAALITTALVAFSVGYLRLDVFSFVTTHLFGLMLWSTLLSFVGGLVLYYAGRNNRTNSSGNTGFFLYDFLRGRTMNPRVRKVKWLALFDFKIFFELRSGLLLWALISLSYFSVHFREVRNADATTPWYGVPAGLNWNLTLLVLFQLWYVFDWAFSEFKALSTMDVINVGFGWLMLFFGIAFMPFAYTINVRYLLVAKSGLTATAQSPIYLGVIAVLHTAGYLISRLSNNAKHAFRTNPNDPAVAHLRSVSVAGGRKVLAGGWWSLSRHPNYLGDILMSWSWALLCGCTSNWAGCLAAYFYPVFITLLLLSRAVHDDAVRREKYGEAGFKRYCELVKWRLVPYVY